MVSRSLAYRTVVELREMKRAIAAALLTLLPLASAAQPVGNDPRWGQVGVGTMASIQRHHQMMRGIPPPYRSMRAPREEATGTIARGAALFEQHCVSCHGPMGRGNGPESRALLPHPANLDWLAGIPARQAEPYMYWSIAEGGAQFGSDMPAFKSQLSRNDIWAVIGYIRLDPGRR